ncbi:MAG: PilN domain-containing protein [Candidatus Thiodiazotropha endolucinida]
MRTIALNFVPGHEKQIALLSRMLFIVGLLLGGIGINLTIHARVHADRMILLEKRINVLREEQYQYINYLKEGPSPSDMALLSKRVKMLSNKLTLRGLWLDDLFFELEATIPDKAYLLQFHYPYEGDTARILVQAESEIVMSETLKRLENNERISNVVLAGLTREDEQLPVVTADVQFALQRKSQ